VVPESFRQFRQRHPDAELQLHPLRSPEQVEALRSGRLDAGFVFSMVKLDRDLARLRVALHDFLDLLQVLQRLGEVL
jgi:DNA-binding transcriptional LysR family regulator